MPFVEIKTSKGITYRYVEKLEGYNEEDYKAQGQGDLTTGSASLVSLGMSKEQHDRIFKKGEKSDD